MHDWCQRCGSMIHMHDDAKHEFVSTLDTGSIVALPVEETPSLEREIASVLNKYSAENESNTPDFILAEYLMACLTAFNTASNSRQAFYGHGVLHG